MRCLSLLLIFFSFLCQAQNIREKSVNLSDGSKLTYQLLNGSLNGLYSTKKGDVTLLRGSYVGNERVGNWYFFNPDNTLFMRYNYDQRKLLYVNNEMLALATIKVNSGDNEVDQKASLPIPIISMAQYFTLIPDEAKKVIPTEDQITDSSLPIEILARINGNGEATYTVTYKKKGKDVVKNFELNIDSFKLDWIPAAYASRTFPSEFSIKTELVFLKNKDEIKRFNWN